MDNGDDHHTRRTPSLLHLLFPCQELYNGCRKHDTLKLSTQYNGNERQLSRLRTPIRGKLAKSTTKLGQFSAEMVLRLTDNRMNCLSISFKPLQNNQQSITFYIIIINF